MMEQIQYNPVLTWYFILLFLFMIFLLEVYPGRIRTVLKKISWDTVWAVFVVWVVILVLRKELYYMPIDGVIQTKDTVLWVDKNIPFFVFGFVCMVLTALAIVIRSNLEVFLTEKRLLSLFESLVIFGFIVLIHMAAPLQDPLASSSVKGIWALIAKTLLPLKMICSGKYIGLLTGILLAYYIADGYKRLNKIVIKKGKINLTANLFIGIGLFLLFFILTQFHFSAGWDKKFTAKLHHAQTGKNVKMFEDLLDAANSITSPSDADKYRIRIAVAIAKTGDSQWAVDTTNAIEDSRVRFHALKQIFVITSKPGNIEASAEVLQQTLDFVNSMKDIDKYRALKEITLVIIKTGDTTTYKKIIRKAIYAAVRIEVTGDRVKALIGIAGIIAALGDINWARDIFQQAVEQAHFVKDSRDKPLLLKEVAVAIAKTGDTQLAAAVARSIPAEETKQRILKEIREKMEKK